MLVFHRVLATYCHQSGETKFGADQRTGAHITGEHIGARTLGARGQAVESERYNIAAENHSAFLRLEQQCQVYL